MKLKFKLNDPRHKAEITLQGYKTLDGNYLFDDHPEMDIAINKKSRLLMILKMTMKTRS